MGLAEQLSINTQDMSWWDWAACRGLFNDDQSEDDDKDEGHPFFEKYESDASEAKAIDSLCSTCPVQKICGNYGHQNKLEGVWGGVYQNGRGGVDRKRNEHKTDAEWKKLKEIFDWI